MNWSLIYRIPNCTRTGPTGHSGRRSRRVKYLSIQQKIISLIAFTVIEKLPEIESPDGFQMGCCSFQLCLVFVGKPPTFRRLVWSLVLVSNSVENCDTPVILRKSQSSRPFWLVMHSLPRRLPEFPEVSCVCMSPSNQWFRSAQSSFVAKLLRNLWHTRTSRNSYLGNAVTIPWS